MAKPNSRQTLKDFCLRQLGYPVLEVNVDDDQVEDRLDDTLQLYQDYHYDGTERVLIKHQVTSSDITNGYITLADAVIGVSRVLDLGQAVQSSNLFNIRYQIHLNDLFDLSAASYVPYVTAMRHVETLEELFVGKKPIRYNRHRNQLHIDMDLDELDVDDYLMVEAYVKLPSATFSEIFNFSIKSSFHFL